MMTRQRLLELIAITERRYNLHERVMRTLGPDHEAYPLVRDCASSLWGEWIALKLVAGQTTEDDLDAAQYWRLKNVVKD